MNDFRIATPARVASVMVAIAMITIMIAWGKIVETVNAESSVVIQNAFTGTLAWYTTPGPKLQLAGRVTTYPKRGIYEFEKKVRFNDGAHAVMKGSIQYELPTDDYNLTALHIRFGSAGAVEAQLVEPTVDKSIYMTGPLMSSKESYAERRNDLIRFVEDQVENGVYKTRQTEERVEDPITGEKKTVTKVDIIETGGIPQRQEQPVLSEFGIKTFNFVISDMPYDEAVEAQIQKQQQAVMDVQTAQAEAKKAEQRERTVEAEGRARAAQAKWEQEAVKAAAVTQAQRDKEVAELDASMKLEVAKIAKQEAEEYKAQQIARAEGDAEYKRKVMEADGALAQKLATYERVQASWAQAIASYPGSWTPAVVMGNGDGSVSGGGAQQLMELLTAKTARELALDLAPRGGHER